MQEQTRLSYLSIIRPPELYTAISHASLQFEVKRRQESASKTLNIRNELMKKRLANSN